MKEVAAQITLRAIYEPRITWKIWQAIRREWIKIGGGRDNFRKHIENVVLDTRRPQVAVRLEDGSRYDYPAEPPSSKTFYNFVYSVPDDTDWTRDNSDLEITPKASPETLQFLHLYLCHTHPDLVAKWNDFDPYDSKRIPVQRLDETFDLSPPHLFIQKPFKLYNAEKPRYARNIAALIKTDEPLEADFSKFGWDLRALIWMTPVGSSKCSRFHFIDGQAWERGGDAPQIQEGFATAFWSRNYTHSSSGPPSISGNDLIISTRLEPPQMNPVYVSITVSEPIDAFSAIEDRDFLAAYMAGASVVFQVGHERKVLLPVPLSRAETARFTEICSKHG